MTENLSPTGVILEVLGDLDIPLLNPIIKTDEGYELMLGFPKDRKSTKEIMKQELESKGLTVNDIDVFREANERYTWAVVIPQETEEENGKY